MDSAAVARAVRGVPYMDEDRGSTLFEHLRSTRARSVLEIGTGHGVSTAYLGAGVAKAGGTVTSLDHVAARYEPGPAEVLDRAAVENVELVEVEDSSYAWWLKQRVEERSDAHGNCEPIYDFCYLDGAHNWTIDGLTVILVEKLLRPGGWLLLDDLEWSYADYRGPYQPGQGPDDLRLSAAEREAPHVRAVFDLIVRQHPSFAHCRVEDATWAWAHKAPEVARRYEVATTKSARAVIYGRLLHTRRWVARRRRRGPLS